MIGSARSRRPELVGDNVRAEAPESLNGCGCTREGREDGELRCEGEMEELRSCMRGLEVRLVVSDKDRVSASYAHCEEAISPLEDDVLASL